MRYLVLALLLSSPLQAKVWEFKKEKNKDSVTFVAVGNPGFLRINGEGGALEGKVTGELTGFDADLKVDLRDFSTGLSLRNTHMHDRYLETAKYQYATFKITRIVPIELNKMFDWQGQLTLKGVTKTVSGSAKFDGKKLKAEFPVALDDFPIGLPSWLGITVARDVAVTVEAYAD